MDAVAKPRSAKSPMAASTSRWRVVPAVLCTSSAFGSVKQLAPYLPTERSFGSILGIGANRVNEKPNPLNLLSISGLIR